MLLAPTVGAVIGTSLAVSEGSSVTIEGHAVATVPSFWDVLGPAVGGAVGGIVLLALGAAVWGRVSYARRGDDVWVATLHEQWGLLLLCRNEEVPADPARLGAVECIVKRPSGEFDRTDALPPFPGKRHGLIATGIRGSSEAGTYEVRWYATEHRARLHEVARMRLTGPWSTGHPRPESPSASRVRPASLAPMSAAGIKGSPRFREYSGDLKRRFGQLSAAFYDCQRTFAHVIDANAGGPAAGSPAQRDVEFLSRPPWPPQAHVLVPIQSYFYLSTAAEHLGGLGVLYASQEVAYPPPLLIRAVMEHAARVVWLLDADIEVLDRAARGYLEDLFSRVEYKKTIGRLVGKQSKEYQDAVETLKNVREEAAKAFGQEKVLDDKGQHRIRGITLPGPEDCVAALVGRLTTDAPIPDVRGVYDRVSNLCHPTVYTHAERWEVVEQDGKPALVSTVEAADHDRPAGVATAAFCDALNQMVRYNGWDRREYEALTERLHYVFEAR